MRLKGKGPEKPSESGPVYIPREGHSAEGLQRGQDHKASGEKAEEERAEKEGAARAPSHAPDGRGDAPGGEDPEGI